MGRMKRGISILLVFVICLLALQNDVGNVSASETGQEEWTVRLAQTEHGRVRFVSSDEDKNTGQDGDSLASSGEDTDEETKAYRTGDKVALEIDPDKGFCVENIRILDAVTEEEISPEAVKEGQDKYSFVMGNQPVIVCVDFRLADEADEGTLEGASGEETIREGSDGENLETEYHFPQKGYVWGKDSDRTDTGKDARLIGETGGRKFRSAAGSDVVIRPGTAHSYGSWGTCEFTVTTSEGQFLGYCAQPNLNTPNGTYRVSELDNDMIKAALLIAPGGVPKLYQDYGRNIYNEKDNNVYAYAHALIGYLYMGSLKGLSTSMAAGVRNMADVLNQLSQNPADPSYGVFQDYLKQYRAYVAYTGAADVQDIVWLEKNPTGSARLKKTSANTEITDGNSCYSLAGAQYGVFRDSGCTQQAAVLTTDVSGNSDTASLDAGTYYVKEITAAKGYQLDPEVYPIQVSAGQTAELNVSDEPIYAPPVIIYKVDRESRETAALGAATLANTQFRVNFYGGHYTKENLPASATRSWVVKAGEPVAGKGFEAKAASIQKPDKISGDAFYQIGGEIMLPLGTISVEEIQAPAGYQLDSLYLNGEGAGGTAEKVHVARIIQDGSQGMVEDGTEYRVADSVIRGDFELTKIDKNTQRPIAGVPFRITSKTTKESHVVMTDENGHYSSSTAYAAHSHRTNGGQAGDGLWFGLGRDGGSVPVDDSVGALPYDTYTIEELKCAANEGKFLYSGSFTITRANYIVSLGNVENADVAIETAARDEATGTHYALADDVTLIDRVTYIGLQKEKTYRLEGTLMNRTTGVKVTDREGNPVTVTKTFIPKDSNGEVEVEFTFDASGLAGNDVVIYEKLYLGDEKLAEHADINDDSQTIHFPAIATSAADQKSGSQMAAAEEEMIIVDTVSYENLRAGRKYKITGILMDQATGKAVLDDNGSKVEAETSFTAKETSGTVEVVFTFPGKKLAGKTLVAFETLKKDNQEYAVHHDITDDSQTIYIPKIGTAVLDNDTKSHISRADGDVTLVDVVKYENLLPGREYVLKGTLVDKETKKAAEDADGKPITAQTAFTPTKKDGSAEVVFRFNGSRLAGETMVVFEELLCSGKLAAEHKDVKDEGQTVYFPSIETTATDKETGKGNSYAGQQVTIEDVVHYENLIPGKTYTVQGVLMDKSNGEPLLDAQGKEIRAKKEFTAKDTEGDVTVVFVFDGSLLAGKTAVAFEELFSEKKSIAIHADIEDEAQTVDFPEIQTQAFNPETGTNLTNASKEVTVVDRVSYHHLIPGRRYHLYGELMDQETGEPALDAKGKKIRADMKFVPEEEEGTVELTFHFPGEGLEGHTFVVFEELSMEKSWFRKTTAAVHKDLEDKAQTIHIPKVWTEAADDETLTHQSMADGEIGVTDQIFYSNVVVGNEYTVKGILMDQETGETLKDDGGNAVTAEASFVAEETQGEVSVEFSLSGTSLAGKTAVIFETLEYEEHPIAAHEDLKEVKQSIYFPTIKTNAKDKADGDKELVIGDMATVTDLVEYENLIEGMEYKVVGVLMDKAAGEALMIDGTPVTAERVFKAEKPTGSIELDFTFPSEGLGEKELVVFEKLYMTGNGEEVADHEDMEDQNQTVKLVRKPEPPRLPRSPKTGDGTVGRICICLILAAASAAAAMESAGRKRRWK